MSAAPLLDPIGFAYQVAARASAIVMSDLEPGEPVTNGCFVAITDHVRVTLNCMGTSWRNRSAMASEEEPRLTITSLTANRQPQAANARRAYVIDMADYERLVQAFRHRHAALEAGQ